MQGTCIMSVFFIFSTKTRKRCNTTVYQETKERLLWVYIILFGGKTLKCMESTLYGENKRDFQKLIFWVFMSVLNNIILKSMESTLPKTSLFSVLSYLPNHYNVCKNLFMEKQYNWYWLGLHFAMFHPLCGTIWNH